MRKQEMHTVIEGNRSFKQTKVAGIPFCQHQQLSPSWVPACYNLGEFDTPTVFGPWANLCSDHVVESTAPGVSIGYHRVQS